MDKFIINLKRRIRLILKSNLKKISRAINLNSPRNLIKIQFWDSSNKCNLKLPLRKNRLLQWLLQALSSRHRLFSNHKFKIQSIHKMISGELALYLKMLYNCLKEGTNSQILTRPHHKMTNTRAFSLRLNRQSNRLMELPKSRMFKKRLKITREHRTLKNSTSKLLPQSALSQTKVALIIISRWIDKGMTNRIMQRLLCHLATAVTTKGELNSLTVLSIKQKGSRLLSIS